MPSSKIKTSSEALPPGIISGASAPKERPADLGAELRALLTIAVPVVLSELGWMSMTLVDLFMVGHLGPAAIGAVGIGNAVYYVPALFGIGILLGLDTQVSQAFGRGDFDGCHQALAQGVYLALLYTPVCMLLVWAVTSQFLSWGISPEVAAPASAYLRMINLSTLPFLLYTAFRRYLQGVGKVRMITFSLVSANLLNWAGNWILINGKLGLPALGVRGSALSTLMARIYMTLVLAAAAWHYEQKRGHPLFRHWAPLQMVRLRALLVLGLPAALQIVMEVGAFGVATVIAGGLTPEALAAHQLTLNYAGITFMVPLGVSAAAAVMVGHAIGAGEGARARRAGWLAIGVGACFMACAMVTFLVFPGPLLRLYTTDAGVLKLGIPLMGLAGLFQIFDGVQTVATGGLRGLGQTRTPMFANLVGYWVFGLPLGYFLCFKAGWGIYGLWIGLTLGLISISIFLLTHWRSESRELLTT